MTDRFGVQLEIGDKVIYPDVFQGSGYFKQGKIQRFLLSDVIISTDYIIVDDEYFESEDIIGIAIFRDTYPEQFL